jgi:hypothetical protein
MSETLSGLGAHTAAPASAIQRSRRASGEELHRHDRLEYRLYTVLLFPFAVLAVLGMRLGGRTRSEPKRHFFGEVIELNRTTVPWIFMGR